MKYLIERSHLNQILTSLVIFLFASTLYILSPDTYSYYYCVLIFFAFVLSSIWFLASTFDGNYFNFHLIFILSFLFVNFIYPVFLYPVNKEYFPVYRYDFNEDIISKATALAFFGISSYFLGASIFRQTNYRYLQGYHFNIRSPRSIILFLTLLSFIFFVLILINFWHGIIHGEFGSTGETKQYLLALFQVTFELAIILEFYHGRDKFIGRFRYFVRYFNKYLMLSGLLFIILFLRVGDRGPVIQLILIIVALYSQFVVRINFRMFVLIVLVGMFVLTFISYARTREQNQPKSENNLSSYFERGKKKMNLNSFFDLGMDLIVNNRNLYVGMDYADKHGYSYGKDMFIYMFAAVPRLPVFMAERVFDSTPTELSSGYIITKEALGPNATWGLGTNLIADLYMNFGLIGVILFMFILGLIIRKLQTAVQTKSSVYNLIMYLFLISYSLYLPRTAYFNPLRFVLWSILIYLFVNVFVVMIVSQQKENLAN